MNMLRGLQENVQEYLLNKNKIIESQIEGNKEVYKRAYFFRLLEALEVPFPKLFLLMGSDLFMTMARKYFDYYPSQHFSIAAMGDNLPDFLSKIVPYKKQSLLSEMAMFELALNKVFISEDNETLESAALKNISIESWPSIFIQFHPSVNIIRLKWNTPDIWKSISKENQVFSPIGEPQTKPWVIWRKELQPYYYNCTEAEAWLVNGCRDNFNFTELCAGLCSWMPEGEVALFMSNLLGH